MADRDLSHWTGDVLPLVCRAHHLQRICVANTRPFCFCDAPAATSRHARAVAVDVADIFRPCIQLDAARGSHRDQFLGPLMGSARFGHLVQRTGWVCALDRLAVRFPWRAHRDKSRSRLIDAWRDLCSFERNHAR